MAATPGQPLPTISTHVLDTERGMPAAGVHVTLSKLGDDGKPVRMTQALTDGDGRVRDLLERPLTPGDYRLEFRLGDSAPMARTTRSSDASRWTCGSSTRPELPRAAAALVVRDDDLPGQLTVRGS